MVKKVGEHITLDIVGTTKEYDLAFYEKLVHKIADAAKVQVLNISNHKFEPQGSTTLALLAESHISFHTFPEHGIISFDFFTCGKVHPRIAENIIKQEIEHTRIVKKEFDRDTKEANNWDTMVNPYAIVMVMVTAFLIKKFVYDRSCKAL